MRRRRAWIATGPRSLLLGVVFAGATAYAAAGGGERGQTAHAGHDHSAHASAATGEPRPERSVRVYRVPDLTLVDMNGHKVPLANALGSDAPVFLNFIFTTCTSICPVMSATFAEVERRLGAEGERVRLVSISIDPEQDNPERLRAFARKHEAGADWAFFTGLPADIVAVQRAFSAHRGGKMSHVPVTFLRPSNSDAWVRFDGLVSASTLVDEYRRIPAR